MEETEIFEEENLEEIKEENNEIEKLKTDLEEAKNKLLRVAAEYDNFRKRTEREKAIIYSRAMENSVTEILPLIDDIESAFESVEDEKGREMLKSRLSAVLEKLSIECFGEVGDEFTPDFHDAISHTDSDSGIENVISTVFKKGYKIGEKVIRHAVVQVEN